MKCNLDFTEGCTAFSYLINGVEFVDYEDNDVIRRIINKLIKRETHIKYLFYLIVDILGLSADDIDNYKYNEAGIWKYLLMNINDDCYDSWEENEEELNNFLKTLTDENINNIKDYLVSLVDTLLFSEAHIDLGWVQYILIELVKYCSDTVYTSSDRPCDCCGDYIENYKLTIEI